MAARAAERQGLLQVHCAHALCPQKNPNKGACPPQKSQKPALKISHPNLNRLSPSKPLHSAASAPRAARAARRGAVTLKARACEVAGAAASGRGRYVRRKRTRA